MVMIKKVLLSGFIMLNCYIPSLSVEKDIQKNTVINDSQTIGTLVNSKSIAS